MKIFNWVHKRFHHTVLKDGLGGNVKTTELATKNTDKQALLKQVALVEVLDGWRDGILTIGTLGFDPLKPFNQRNEYLVLQSEEEDEKNEEGEYSSDGGDDNEENFEHEELNPLMSTTFGHSFEDFDSNPDNGNLDGVDDVPLTPFMGSPGLNAELNRDGEQQKKKGERITLADLFLADADVEGEFDSGKVPNSGEKPALKAKNGLSFAKKFIPRVKEDSRPIQNLQRLMKKMLKRKIHPDFDAKMQKSADCLKPGAIGPVPNCKHEASEFVTLLPNQGAAVDL